MRINIPSWSQNALFFNAHDSIFSSNFFMFFRLLPARPGRLSQNTPPQLFFQEQKQLIKKIEIPFGAGENRLKKTGNCMNFHVHRLSNLQINLNEKLPPLSTFSCTCRISSKPEAEGPGIITPLAQHLFEKPGELVPGVCIPILALTSGPNTVKT
jgi:hypothetical protein